MTASLELVPTFKDKARPLAPRYLGMCLAAPRYDKPARPVALFMMPRPNNVMELCHYDLLQIEVMIMGVPLEQESVLLQGLLDLKEAINRGTNLGLAQEYPAIPAVRPQGLKLVVSNSEPEVSR